MLRKPDQEMPNREMLVRAKLSSRRGHTFGKVCCCALGMFLSVLAPCKAWSETAAPSSVSPAPFPKLAPKVAADSWAARIESATPGSATAQQKSAVLVILRGEKEELRLTGHEFSLGIPGMQVSDSPGIADVTGDATAELVVLERTSSRECCSRLRIFELGKSLRTYPPLMLGTLSPIHFENVDGAPGLELPGVELSFGGWGSKNFMSPSFRVVYQPRDGNWKLWRPKEAAPAAAPEALVQAIQEKLKEIDVTHGAQDLPELLTSSVVGPIYRGYPKEARALLLAVWPKDRRGREAYQQAIAQRLRESPLAQALESEIKIFAVP